MDKQEDSTSIIKLTLPLIEGQCPNTNIISNNGVSQVIITRNNNSGEHFIIEEVKKQVWLAGPLILVGLLTFSLHIISLMFVGHLGELPLSAASLATSFAYVTGFSLLIGMSSALETICGQSYGAQQFHMVGIYTQRAILVLLLVSIPIAIIWFYTEQILVTLGQDHKIAKEAGSYVLFMIPSLVAYSLIQCFIRFFQTQNMIFPMVLTSGITTLLHILICWTFVYKFGLGSKGAALANTVSYYINALLMGIFVIFSSSCSKTWTGFSKASFQDIPAYLKMAIPSATMICLDMWSFEMVVLISGLLPNPMLETSVLSIRFVPQITPLLGFGIMLFTIINLSGLCSLNTTSFVWVIPEGFSGAVSTRVSNELGAGNPQVARLAVWVVFCMTLSESMLMVFILLSVRNIWGYAYSSDTEIVRYLADIMPLLALTSFLDGLTCILSGAIRGIGWQGVGACINLASFYLVGVPVTILLAFVLHIGGRGLLLGLTCALIIQVICFLCIAAKTDWDREAENAMERVFKSRVPPDTVIGRVDANEVEEYASLSGNENLDLGVT